MAQIHHLPPQRLTLRRSAEQLFMRFAARLRALSMVQASPHHKASSGWQACLQHCKHGLRRPTWPAPAAPEWLLHKPIMRACSEAKAPCVPHCAMTTPFRRGLELRSSVVRLGNTPVRAQFEGSPPCRLFALRFLHTRFRVQVTLRTTRLTRHC